MSFLMVSLQLNQLYLTFFNDKILVLIKSGYFYVFDYYIYTFLVAKILD